MGSLRDPKPWVPYINTKDCSQGFCSLSCPQWCYIIFPPPPPSAFLDDKSQSSLTFSPLVIAIIGILASAFLLVSYYAIISKYCGNSSDTSTRRQNQQSTGVDVLEDNNHDNDNSPSQHEPWLITTTGLDESLIKAITLIKYIKGDGLVGSTDCSVCLGEFLEDDTLRLLPKCSHAFHVACIDTWLRSHSNCPLCRANIVSPFAQPRTPSLVDRNNHNHVSQDLQNQVRNHEETRSSDQEGTGMDVVEQANGNILPKSPFRALSDLGSLGLREGRVIDIRDQGAEGEQMMRRSFSMDHSHETRISISDILQFDQQDEACQVKNCQLHDQSLKEAAGESSKSEIDSGTSSSHSSTNVVLQCVMNSVAMKRSFSSGRFLFSKNGKGSSVVIPE